jgi:hypothetical protein
MKTEDVKTTEANKGLINKSEKSGLIPSIRKPDEKEGSKTSDNEKSDAKLPVKKTGFNLESTLKVVADLHLRSIHRENLIKRIHDLDAFEITLRSEAEELEQDHFRSCQLTIADDKGRSFTTKTSGLIRLVSSFIREACVEKLAEIESYIVLPQQ